MEALVEFQATEPHAYVPNRALDESVQRCIYTVPGGAKCDQRRADAIHDVGRAPE